MKMPSRRSFLATLGLTLVSARSLVGGENRRRTRWEMIAHDEPIDTPRLKPDPSTWSDSTITAAWIGHSTVLINFFGTKIITDPLFSDRIGVNVAGLFTIGPRRLVYPAMMFDELPPIDIILISHAHFDHLDVPSLKNFHRSIPIIMAQNTTDVIEGVGFETVYELDWGRWTQVGDVRIEALEVNHFGWRYPWEPDRSRGYADGRSYNAYLISTNGRHIVFGGDTTGCDKFKKLGERNLPIELAIMPIGAYDPWIKYHCNPEQALQMTDDMGAKRIFPIHWNTLIQSEEPTMEPIRRLKKAAEATPGRIVLDDIGQTWTLEKPLVERSVIPFRPGAAAQ